MKILDNFLNQFQEFLPKVITQFSYDNRLQQALLYATMNGGKRIRPLLCFIIAHTVNKQVSISNILAMSLALEVVHCYSLVHDDLPAMDNDDLRRGLPTTHKQFDEPTAILVGDALQTMAFQIISSHYILQDAEIKLKLIGILSEAIGAKGMVNGQFLDMNLDTDFDSKDLSHIKMMHQQKTGALIKASAITGAIIANHQYSDLHIISEIGELLGELFQIQDDILDVTQSTEILGKTAGKDIIDNKPTITALMGIENAKLYLLQITEKLHKLMDTLKLDTELLKFFINNLVKRKF